MSQPTLLQPPVPAEGSADQFRITTVQLLNWGRYSDLHVVPVARAGTAILGPSGAGKSQILDAIAAVIMPNPQEFNQAARDDRGRRAERTVYTYARGKTDELLDQNRRSTSPEYRRRPGSPFPCGVAVTWADGHGRAITAARLVWVSEQMSTQDEISNNTVYALVDGPFELQRLSELRPTRTESSPITQASVERLLDPGRDLVTTSQPTMQIRMRRSMGIGSTEESQKLALTLLRRAQSSKGIFSINDLFKQFVLTEPLALQRWEVALETYREAAALFDAFETARRRMEALQEVPRLADKYQEAARAAFAKRQLLSTAADEAVTRVEVWHSEKLAQWSARAIEDNRLEEAVQREELAQAELGAGLAKQRWSDLMSDLTAAGGDRAAAIQAQLDPQLTLLKKIQDTREAYLRRLVTVGLSAPNSSGDLTLLLTEIAQQITRRKADDKALAERLNHAIGVAWELKKRLTDADLELQNARRRRSNIPESAAVLRAAIAAATGVSEARLPYAGELIQIRPEHREWETAIVRVLGAVASDLLVSAGDWPAVTSYVNATNQRGRVVLAPAQTGVEPRRPPVPGTVPAMVDLDPVSPFSGWLAAELVEHHSYLCVDSPAELRNPRPAGAKGAVTRNGMVTGVRGRVIKDDRPTAYSWIGRDNAALVDALAKTLEGCRREWEQADRTAGRLGEERARCREQITTLEGLRETSWSDVDTSSCQRRINELSQQLDSLAEARPQLERLKHDLDRAHQDQVSADGQLAKVRDELSLIERNWAALCQIEDEAKDVLESCVTLTDEERGSLDGLPFAAPASFDTSKSLKDASELLRSQIDQHDKDRSALENHLATIFTHYKTLDELAEIDGTIESLTTVLAIHQALVTDDLPGKKSAWLTKVRKDMNDGLSKLLVQIDDDDKSLRRGIQPINDVLNGVEFRTGSTLTIDIVERRPTDLTDFKTTITRYTGNLLAREDDQAESAFVRLRRELSRLEDRSRSGDSWRRRVFDAREHVEFRAVESRPEGTIVVHEGVAGMSGGEGQELIAFILGAALRYRLGDGTSRVPRYAPIVLDEGFVKADADYTGRALAALRALGFQLVIGAPREKVTAFEDHVASVAYIGNDPENPENGRVYPLSIEDAVRLERSGSDWP